jgi:hypothetical protein
MFYKMLEVGYIHAQTYMISPKRHVRNPIDDTIEAEVEAPKAILYTLRRPWRDGRFLNLIPSLLKRSGLSPTLVSLSTHSYAKEATPVTLVKTLQQQVRFSTLTGELFPKAAKALHPLAYINSIDLQALTTQNKIFFGQKIWVDVLENDFTNTIANRRYWGWKLSTRLWIIKILQKLLPWNNIVTVAEECFFGEIKFGLKKPILLGHEMVKLSRVEHVEKTGFDVVLVTGTLGRHYGTLDAVAWSLKHQKSMPHILSICGYSPDPAFADELRNACALCPEIKLELFDSYHPQQEILTRMVQANYLLCPYHISNATKNRIPTKFPEAVAAGCTLLIPQNPTWERWCLARNISFRFIETPQTPVYNSRKNTNNTWVSQRLCLQDAAILAALAVIRQSL